MGIIHEMNINELDLNLLRVFQALSAENSVTRAADRLGMSQPAVSNALKRLRLAFGDELFVRGSRGIVPTPRCEELAASLSDAMAQIEAALVGGSRFDPARLVEPISITCADEEILLHGSDILKDLTAQRCQAPVQFLPLNTGYNADMLWRNRLSITITTMIYAPDGLIQRKAYDEHLVCLMRADHPAGGGLDLDSYLAAEHLLIAPMGGAPSGYLDDWLRNRGLARNIRLISHSFGSAPLLVKQTGLLATLPSRQAASVARNPDFVVADLPFPAPAFSLHLFWSERYDDDPVNVWLRGVVHGALTKGGRALA